MRKNFNLITLLAFGAIFSFALLFSHRIAYVDELNEWVYWIERISSNPVVIAISIIVGLHVKNFKVALALGLFSLFIFLLTCICSPQYLFIATFFTASFVVVIGVIAMVDLLKGIGQWMLAVE
jgi:hypothetical protein